MNFTKYKIYTNHFHINSKFIIIKYKQFFIFSIISFFLIYLCNYNQIYFHHNRKFSVLIVYVICGESKFSIHLSQYPVYELRCNNKTNYKDMFEAGLILDFIIKVYYNPLADKYIFCQGHDISYHYKTNFWDRVKYITSIKYFDKHNYGGLYCIYLHSYKSNKYLKKWAGDVERYMKNNHILRETISDLNITLPCCATFFVSHKFITKNKRFVYLYLRKELTKYVVSNINNSINNYSTNKRAAFFMEFYWGKLFALPNSIVPFPPDCKYNMKLWK